MTLREFLLKVDVDLSTNKSLLANQLTGDLALQGYIIDFNNDITDVSDEDLYQIGRSLILSENKGTFFTKGELIDKMREIIKRNTLESY